MKSVLVIRHAKSSWADPDQDDFDRPLNDRGKRDAPQMAKRLVEKGILVDAFISSPARRARKTAAFFAAAYQVEKDQLILVDGLYHAGPADFFQAIVHAPAAATTIAVFSHNPGITEFVNLLTDTRIDDMPTSAVFGVKAPIRQWSEFTEATKEFWFFDYPRALDH